MMIYNFPLILQKLPVDHFSDLTHLSLVISGLCWFGLFLKNIIEKIKNYEYSLKY